MLRSALLAGLSGAFVGLGLALIRVIYIKLFKKNSKGSEKSERDYLELRIEETKRLEKKNDEECFLALLDELKSSADIQFAWQKLNLESTNSKASELINRNAEAESQAGEISESKVKNEKAILRSLLAPVTIDKRGLSD